MYFTRDFNQFKNTSKLRFAGSGNDQTVQTGGGQQIAFVEELGIALEQLADVAQPKL